MTTSEAVYTLSRVSVTAWRRPTWERISGCTKIRESSSTSNDCRSIRRFQRCRRPRCVCEGIPLLEAQIRASTRQERLHALPGSLERHLGTPCSSPGVIYAYGSASCAQMRRVHRLHSHRPKCKFNANAASTPPGRARGAVSHPWSDDQGWSTTTSLLLCGRCEHPRCRSPRFAKYLVMRHDR